MRKIVSATYMTLDGDIANMENWHFDFFNDEAIATAQAQLDESDTLIMGRTTYDGFAPAWSERAGADDFSDRMNSIKKYVVSSTLSEPDWTNCEVLSGDVVEQVRGIKAEPGKNILQYGFGDVSRLLLRNGLLDELRIWLHPVLSGKASPDQQLYRELPQTNFTLTDTNVFSNGIVVLTYANPQAA